VTDVTPHWWHPAVVPVSRFYDIRYTPNPRTRQKGGSPVNAMTENHLPAEMRASDSDRDAVVSDLSEHFQAGRLTAGEFDERMGQALAARTRGELRDLLADLPGTPLAPDAPAARSLGAEPWPLPGRFAPPLIAVLAGIGITTAVLVNVAHGRWGFIWLLLPALLIARRLSCYPRAPRRCGQKN
jgi:hypothetical protein